MGFLHVFLTTVVCFHGFCATSSVLLLSSVCSEVFLSWQDFLFRACVRTLTCWYITGPVLCVTMLA